MSTLTIENVDYKLLVTQVQSLLDLAYRERKKAEFKKQPKRLVTSRELEAVLDMLSDAVVT